MTSDRYVIISTDGHCGADIADYKPYLASRFHDEFDHWADNYFDAWGAIDESSGTTHRVGVSSYLSPLNWDSSKRLEELELNGIAAEVLFPNTVPPFQPSGSITAPPPTSTDEYERRFAGIQAHNRWLADFCAEAPGRRAGIAQVYLNDVDAAIHEARWAREHGLMGLLLPADHFHKLSNLYYPRYDPLWKVCTELDFPVHRHGVLPSEAAGGEAGLGAPAIGLLEAPAFHQRSVAHMVFGGAFENFPELKFVMSECSSAWMTAYMQRLDYLAEEAKKPRTIPNMFAGAAVESLLRKPSEYIRQNCWVGSFLDEEDIAKRHDLGVDRVMWGADFPHHEGTGSHTLAALRLNFADVPDAEVRKMTSINAANCYGFDLELLKPVADRVGPTGAEIHTPLPIEELPRYPEDTICPTFAKSWSGNVALH